ncbi:MAG: DUF4276 family protein [Burkholderiaceae bacterium]
MRHLVFLLEEPSAQDALQAWLPTWLPASVTPHFIVFQGKQDLEKRMVLRMRYWLQPNSRFVVLRDQDSGDCKVVKAALVRRCVEAGRPDALVRVACRELESFFVGDWHAVAAAFGKPALARLAGKAMYRNPDALGSPSRELAKHLSGYQKRDGARRIAPLIEPARNASRSFHALRTAVQALGAA